MTRMKGRHAFMEQCVADGMEYIFGNPGTTELAFMDALQDYPQIQYILALQESVATAMADAYARASGRPTLVNLHVAAGLGHAMGMLYNAHRGGTPMVITAGQQDTRLVQQEPLLWGDLVSMARQYTKWSTEVQRAEDLPMVLSRAFKVAAEPPQGPVFLSLPQNILDHEIDVTIKPTRHSSWRTRPDPEAVQRAAALLAKAERPVLMCGDGIAVSGAQEEVARLGELIGAKIYTGGRSEVNIATNHPQYVGGFSGGNIEEAHRVLDDCDVLMAVGMPVFTQIFSYEGNDLTQPIIPPQTRFIHMDISSWQVGKNYQPDVGLVGDPKYGLADLATAVKQQQTPQAKRAANARAQEITDEKKRRQAVIDEDVQRVWDQTPIHPYRLIGELREVMKPGTIITGGGGTSGGMAMNALIDFTEPGTFFSGRGGALGFGLPGALGVKLARPDRPVVGLVAEGDGMYTNQALWTAAHYRIPVTYVVVNNGTYRILKINMMHYLGSQPRRSGFIGMDLSDPPLDYAKLAAVWGIPSRRVERPEDVREALVEALNVTDGPSLVDVVVDPSI